MDKKTIVYISMVTEKEIEYKSTIMEMRNIIKNQERVIEELMLKILNIKIENEVRRSCTEVGEVVNKSKSKRYQIIFIQNPYGNGKRF
jgi:hypothetical protein